MYKCFCNDYIHKMKQNNGTTVFSGRTLEKLCKVCTASSKLVIMVQQENVLIAFCNANGPSKAWLSKLLLRGHLPNLARLGVPYHVQHASYPFIIVCCRTYRGTSKMFGGPDYGLKATCWTPLL